MRMVILSILLAVFLPAHASAQSTSFDRLTPAFPTKGERLAADIASWGLVAASLALDTRDSWNNQERTHALQMQGARIFLTWGWASIAKGIAHRQRPCATGPDVHGYNYADACGIDHPDESFYSMHTALAFSTLGGSKRISVSLPIAIGAGGMRVAANKHWLTDVLAGAGVGAITSRIR